jgi:hypothetical protein
MVSSFDPDDELDKKTSPFDALVQIIHRAAELILNDKKMK